MDQVAGIILRPIVDALEQWWNNRQKQKRKERNNERKDSRLHS